MEVEGILSFPLFSVNITSHSIKEYILDVQATGINSLFNLIVLLMIFSVCFAIQMLLFNLLILFQTVDNVT